MQEQFCERPVTRASSGRCSTLCHLEGQVAVDMRVGWPQDVKKMLLKQARMVYWKRWAAKHEYEELKGGVWLELIQAMLRRTTNEFWTEEHRHVARKLVVEGGWMQKRLYDIDWSDEKKCGGSYKEEGTEKNGLYLCPSCTEVANQIPAELEKREKRAKISNDNWKWQRGITAHPLREGNWRKSHLTVHRWESEKQACL